AGSPLVVVTFPVGDRDRALFHQELSGQAEVVFADGLSDEERLDALSKADVLLTWLWEREIRPGEPAAMSGLRFAQLVSAGVDSLPFDQVPEGAVVAGNVGAYAEPMAEHALAMILAAAKRL